MKITKLMTLRIYNIIFVCVNIFSKTLLSLNARVLHSKSVGEMYSRQIYIYICDKF